MSSGYLLTILIFTAMYVSLALSLNILTGFAGQVSLGHAAFLGIGAYTSAILTARYEYPFWLAFLAAIIITGIIGTFLGLPSLRVRHDFLVLATMGINFVVVSIFKYVDFFGGAMGLVNIPAPTLFGITFRGGVPYLLLTAAYAAFTLLVCWYLSKTWSGLAFQTIRNDEDAAASLGVNPARYKIYAFGISAALAGGVGSLYAHFLGSVFPDNFVFVESIGIMSMVIFGGIGTLRGPIIGAILLRLIPEWLRFIQDYRFTFYGALLVLMMLFQPMGLLGNESWLWQQIVRLFRGASKDKKEVLG
ncbi:MAG: branched-chain amino acid ABC transporter permease [Anaerolineales bacterium]